MADSPLYEWTAQGVAATHLEQWLHANRWQWLYAERPEATELLWLAAALQANTPWTHWRHGRAFAATGELAFWRQPDQTYQVRWLATTTTTPPPAEAVTWFAAAPWLAYDQTPVATLLHGNRGDGSSGRWGEARIPRYLHYPVNSGDNPVPEQVALLTQRYHRAGIVSLTRLVAVAGV